jgi:hypothetical protein
LRIENAAGSSYERIILDMKEKKCFYMAASSILTELAIEVAKKAEVFINAQEMSSQGPAWSLPASSIPILDSAEEIQRILEKKVSLCIANILNE